MMEKSKNMKKKQIIEKIEEIRNEVDDFIEDNSGEIDKQEILENVCETYSKGLDEVFKMIEELRNGL